MDLASPQSPESFNVVDEFGKKGSQPKASEEEGGLTMKLPSPTKQRKDKTADEDNNKEPQQRLMRCLSDPGPAAEEEDEDEPFLPWEMKELRPPPQGRPVSVVLMKDH